MFFLTFTHRIIKNMILSKSCYQQHYRKYKSTMNKTYDEAINCLNSLQSNLNYIQNATTTNDTRRVNKIELIEKYLLRIGITMPQINTLSVIHVAGTKGKGSTCAFCESIIRQYGYKTGFFSSPHLITANERIKLNGKAVNKNIFADYIFKIYDLLLKTQNTENDLPAYFQFLNLVAFKIFLDEKVDVVILEVGIGGEYDSTNVVRNTPIVGITSLGFDHTNLLGNTLEAIAWQKAGIMKKHSKVFTVEQPRNAMEVLQKRSIEKKVSSFEVVPNFSDYIWNNGTPELGIKGEMQKINASLAIQLSHNWLKYCSQYPINVNPLNIPDNTKIGLETCKWPGRYQIIKNGFHTFYIDGAHTYESLNNSVEWFMSNSKSENKVLMYNSTGNRNVTQFFKILNQIPFNQVIFVPNISKRDSTILDQMSHATLSGFQLENCLKFKELWSKLENYNENRQTISIFDTVESGINSLTNNKPIDILIVGSLHLVGAALSILDPELKTF